MVLWLALSPEETGCFSASRAFLALARVCLKSDNSWLAHDA